MVMWPSVPAAGVASGGIGTPAAATAMKPLPEGSVWTLTGTRGVLRATR